MVTEKCQECDSDIEISSDAVIGDIITCPCCQAEYEVKMEDGLLNLPGFELHQIKLKFGMCRFYFETAMENKKLEFIIEMGIEQEVNNIIKNLKDENI